MRRYAKYLTVCIMVLAVVLGFNAMKVSAAQVRTGTLGDNNKVQYTYDESTKTLTLTGSDSGLGETDYTKMGKIYNLCPDVEKIILKNFAPIGDGQNMFYYLTALKEIDMQGFDTSKVTNMAYMFYGCGNLTDLNVSGFDTSNVTSMECMFYGCGSLTDLDVSEFDTSNVASMVGMFIECTKLSGLEVDNWNTANVTDMKWMFYNCSNLNSLDLSSWNTAKVTDMSWMFASCRSMNELNINGWDTSKVTDMSNMFGGCNSLSSLNVKELETNNVTKMNSMFADCMSLKKLDVSGFNTTKVTDISGMFYGCEGLTSLDVSGFNTSKVTDMSYMFSGCEGLTSLDLSDFDTSEVTDMTYMFWDCKNMTSIDLSDFDTSNVTSMYSMFSGCEGLTSLDLSDFDTSEVTDMTYMFLDCKNMTSLDVSNFDTSNVTSMFSMFRMCKELRNLNLSNFDTSKVTNMQGMFYMCEGINSLDLSNFDTSAVTDMTYMFFGCNGLCDLNVSNFDTANVTKINSMFAYCDSLTTLDLSSFDTSKVTNMSDMLYNSYDINELHTPKVIPEGVTISLPMTFTAPSGKRVDVIDSEYKNMVLTRDAISIVHPKKMYPGEKAQLLIKMNGEVKDVSENQNYRWIRYNNLASISTNGVIEANNDVDGEGIVTVLLLEKDSGRILAKCNVDILPLTTPVITTQPTDITKNEGETAVFKVEALANGITYQWQYKMPGSNVWYNSGMTGSNTASLNVVATAARNDYQYRCVIKDKDGNKVTSNPAKLTVVKAIAITGQPASATVNEGEKVTFKVEAKGTDLTYQWQFKSAGSEYWANSSMAGSKTNSITVEATSARNNYQYRCVVKDANGNKATTDAAKLTVEKSIEISGQPASASVSEGAKVSFKVDAKGTGLTYQWQFKSATATYWTNSTMAGSKTNSITVEATAARNGYQYRCVVKDAGGSKVTTDAAKLTVTKSIEITGQPASASVSEGAKVTFKVDAKGTGLTYQWQFKSASSSFWADSSMAGSKTNSITVEATVARNGYQYRCVVKDTGGSKVTTEAAKLTVTKSIEISGQPASASVSEGEKVTFKVEAKGTGLTYQWQFKSATATYWTNSTMTGSKTNSITVEATSARNGYQYRCVVKDANGSKVTTNAAKLTVNKSIEITAQPASATVAEGASATFKVEAKGTGLTYQWQFKSASSSFWADSSMAGSKTNSITVKGTTPRNGYQYRCVVKDANGSKVTTNAANLTVQ